LTTRKRDQDGTIGGRPSIKSSHEKVKVKRDPKRAGATTEARPRARTRPGLPGARPLPGPSRAGGPGGASGPSPLARPRAPRKPRAEGRAPLRSEGRGPLRSEGRGPAGVAKTKADLADAKPDANGAWSVASDQSRSIAGAIAAAAIDKKAVAVEILDVAGRVDYADFLVIMTGRSDRHAQALAQSIEEALRPQGRRPVAVEGLPNGTWVLMDFGDVVVHVFQEEARQLYDIEGLWLDARRLPVPAPERS
jgi:ribosome-associated protein